MTDAHENRFEFDMERAEAYRLIAFLHARNLVDYTCITTSPALPKERAVVAVAFHVDAEDPQ